MLRSDKYEHLPGRSKPDYLGCLLRTHPSLRLDAVPCATPDTQPVRHRRLPAPPCSIDANLPALAYQPRPLDRSNFLELHIHDSDAQTDDCCIDYPCRMDLALLCLPW